MATEKRRRSDGEVVLEPRTKKKLQRPRLYKVLFHNDDFTPREFVVLLLEQIFHYSEAEATRIMLYIHNHGVGVVGVYTFAVAETKVAEVMTAAERAQFPLLCTMEPERDGEEDDDDGGGGPN